MGGGISLMVMNMGMKDMKEWSGGVWPEGVSLECIGSI